MSRKKVLGLRQYCDPMQGRHSLQRKYYQVTNEEITVHWQSTTLYGISCGLIWKVLVNSLLLSNTQHISGNPFRHLPMQNKLRVQPFTNEEEKD